MSYIGNEPIVSATRTITEVTATAGQTVFTANGGYTVGYIDVFLNGAQLQTVDFTATNGSSITLTEAAQVGDVLKLVAWGTFLASTALSNTNPSYSGTLTGGSGVFAKGSSNGVTIGDVSTNSNAVLKLQGTSAGKNFQIANNLNVGGLEFTPSTADGGTTYSTPAMALTSSGNLGIGTSSPSANVKLDVVSTGTRGYIKVEATSTTGTEAGIRIKTPARDWYLYNNYDASGALITYDGTAGAERMRIDSSGNFQTFCVNAMRPAYDCRAWVNFNGTGTVAIRASGNVSSITDNGAGDYTVNFTTAMPDANYASNVSAGQSGGNQQSGINMFENNARAAVSPTTSAFRFTTFAGGAFVDHAQVLVSVFR